MFVCAYPRLTLSSRMRLITSACSLWLPWVMLILAQFIPASASISSISDEELLGPMVQMILVRRVLRGPVCERDPQGTYLEMKNSDIKQGMTSSICSPFSVSSL